MWNEKKWARVDVETGARTRTSNAPLVTRKTKKRAPEESSEWLVAPDSLPPLPLRVQSLSKAKGKKGDTSLRKIAFMNNGIQSFKALLLVGTFSLMGCDLLSFSSSESDSGQSNTVQPIAVEESTEIGSIENEVQPNEEGGNDILDIPTEGGGEAPGGDDGALIAVVPQQVDFKSVSAGETKEEEIQIVNNGSSELQIFRIDFQGPSAFSLIIDDIEYPVGVLDYSAAPLVVPGGESFVMYAKFSPENTDPASASITIQSNASNSGAGGAKVILQGNTSGPKIDINPSTVEFSPSLVGELNVIPVTIQSVGGEPLVIHSIEFEEGASSAYQLDYSQLPGFEDGSKPSKENPLLLDINQTAELWVRFVPEVESDKDENNQAIPEFATIAIENNTTEPEKEVEVTGIGIAGNCPVAVIVIQEGEQVIPQTELHLFGDQSFSPSGTISKWEWTVQQPTGSQSVFTPSADSPNPKFEANVAGQYEFQLTVYDGNETESCVPDTATLVVIPDDSIHVELLWDTPTDPDQTDEGPEAGTDLDLHFMHPFASGADVDEDGIGDGWFDQPFDCFWFNPTPMWASFDPSIDDNPSLDRDDTDGAGPENLNLNIPEDDTTYKVGVHYWNDHDFGPSYATILVYIYSDLVYSAQDVKLVNQDMWEACTIDWPSGIVSPIDDGYKIIPDYQNPNFFQP